MPTHPLRQIRDQAMDCVALNDRQRRLLANPSPEPDSLFEFLQALRVKYRIADEDIVPAFTALREVIQSNDLEFMGERRITHTSDTLLREERRMRRPAMLADQPMSIKRLAETLRPALLILRAPDGHSAAELIEARRLVMDLVQRTPTHRLTCDSMRVQLRGASHRTLMAFVEKREATS